MAGSFRDRPSSDVDSMYEKKIKEAVKKEAMKQDADKLPWDLLPIKATEGMLAVLAFGAKKYAPHNWRKGFNHTRLIAAAFRHLAAIARGEDLDPESGLPHVDHLACCVAFLSEHQKDNLGTDDRYKSEKKAFSK